MSSPEASKPKPELVVYFVVHVHAYRGTPSGAIQPPPAADELSNVRLSQAGDESLGEFKNRVCESVNKISMRVAEVADAKKKLVQLVEQTRRAAGEAGFDGFANDLVALVEEHL
jgi:hypothetical protein